MRGEYDQECAKKIDLKKISIEIIKFIIMKSSDLLQIATKRAMIYLTPYVMRNILIFLQSWQARLYEIYRKQLIWSDLLKTSFRLS